MATSCTIAKENSPKIVFRTLLGLRSTYWERPLSIWDPIHQRHMFFKTFTICLFPLLNISKLQKMPWHQNIYLSHCHLSWSRNVTHWPTKGWYRLKSCQCGWKWIQVDPLLGPTSKSYNFTQGFPASYQRFLGWICQRQRERRCGVAHVSEAMVMKALIWETFSREPSACLWPLPQIISLLLLTTGVTNRQHYPRKLSWWMEIKSLLRKPTPTFRTGL